MSQYDGRLELWDTAQQAIDLAEADLREFGRNLSGGTPEDRVRSLGTFLEEYGFDTNWDLASIDCAFVSESHHFNDEDMRKGLRHGHAAVVACGDTHHTSDLVASAACAIGLAATLMKMFGKVSVIAVPHTEDLTILADEDVFSSPDCVFTFRGATDGTGFQHTITSSGNHLAGATIELVSDDDSNLVLRELHAAVATLIDELEEPASLTPTVRGFELRALESRKVREIIDQISALVRTRVASTGAPVTISVPTMNLEMLPSRILARRIKSFTDTMKVKMDRVQKSPIGEPTHWGAVSHEVATALVGYPVIDDESDGPDAIAQAMTIAKAAAGAGLDIFGDMEFRGFVDGERIRALRDRDLERTPRRWLGVHPVLPPKDDRRRTVNIPDVIVRGPGLPEPKVEDFIDEDEHS